MSSERRLLTGWGRTSPTAAHVVAPRSVEEIARLLADPPPRGLIARGLGRSYGDAAQDAGGVVLDCTTLPARLDIDADRGIVTASTGTSFDTLIRELLPRGWFVPVTPGTRYVTVGGAVAADIHGKNHHVAGSFGCFLLGLTLVLPGGRVVQVSDLPNETGLSLRPAGSDPKTHLEGIHGYVEHARDEPLAGTGNSPLKDPDALHGSDIPASELFWATVGGMGLTGVVVDATFRCIPVETSRMWVQTRRAANLDELLATMTASDEAFPYSVAWIDLLARGSSLGRGVITHGRHAAVDELPAKMRRDPLRFDARPRLTAPPWAPSGLLNAVSVRAFNEWWYRKACFPGGRSHTAIQSIPAFFHPLDGVDGWNRLYGNRGFVQYQFVVPFDAEDTLRSIVADLAAMRVPSFLAVLKRFGSRNPAPLSFPQPGWTLALDIPVGDRRLPGLLRDFDTRVAEAGGRVYLAKDSRLSADMMAAMYPELDAWRAVRSRIDPHGVLRSDLARRLDL
ncbi:MAG TPA: FAD-binding oxidoreductase [Actinopolymorphaceae bacterium]|jgi:decaprenylphospho-beta-D-ribofuranose 2-oxidase